MTTSAHKRAKSTTSFTASTSAPRTPLRAPAFDYIAQDSPDQHVSPTKALAASRLNHDLTTLTTWLESLFHPTPIPSALLKWRDEVLAASNSNGGFESGILASGTPGHGAPLYGMAMDGASVSAGSENDILNALKALKQANLSSNHLRSLVHDAEVEELRYLKTLQLDAQAQRDESLPARILLDELHAALPVEGREALDSLCESAVILGLNLHFQHGDDAKYGGGNVNGESDETLSNLFSRRILEHAHRNLVLQEQLRELGMLQRVLGERMASQDGERETKVGMDDNTLNDEQAEQIHVQSAQYNRNAKQVNLKIMEYEDRVRGLERQVAGLRTDSADLREVLEARRRVEERKSSVAALEQRISAFHGLPPDLEASRSEVRRAMDELAALMKERDGLFMRMGNG